jgi:pyruvate/2-oxoacid:ferredoxin oxidoreductase beta subunit
MYERKGRLDVNVVAVAGDGGTADAGFQALSAAAERDEKMLYVCYDNEGYMNTGYQRSSTISLGSRTSTTPIGDVINGKRQHQKYVPLILAMHERSFLFVGRFGDASSPIIPKTAPAVKKRRGHGVYC